MTNSPDNCLIRNRNSNYGIVGNIGGKIFATTNTGPGQSSEKITLYNSGHGHSLIAIWSFKNDQDDIEWIRSQSNDQNHTITIEKSKHNNDTGFYAVHVYGASGDGNWVREELIGMINLEF